MTIMSLKFQPQKALDVFFTTTSTFALADHTPPFDCLPFLKNSCEE